MTLKRLREKVKQVKTDRGDIDLRIKRTRAAIQAAFEKLAMTKNVDKITVKELTELAQINRKTFYLHYENIEALYDDRIKQLMDEFFIEYETTPERPKDLWGHAERFFLFLAAQSEVTERLICNPGIYDFGSQLYYSQMMKYKDAGNPFEWLGEAKEALVLDFMRSTALNFYRGWVKKGKQVPKQEAAELLANITCNGVSALMR